MTSMTELDRVVRIGTLPRDDQSYGRRMDVYARIKYDGERLSITGVEGPRANGDAYGSAGQQLRLTPQAFDRYDFAPGWDADTTRRFFAVWDRWHLNDMRAECEHQREEGWTYATHAGQDCPVCGYRIGSAWLREDVPADVIDFLASLPETDKQPAWI